MSHFQQQTPEFRKIHMYLAMSVIGKGKGYPITRMCRYRPETRDGDIAITKLQTWC